MQKTALAVLAFSLQFCVTDLSYAQEQDSKFDRGGFTFLLGFGAAVTEHPRSGTATGYGGPSFGLGGFVSRNVAVMYRGSSTFTNSNSEGLSFISVSAQYWPSDRLNLEVGPGVGTNLFTNSTDGYGLLLGVGYIIAGGGTRSLQVALEYFPIVESGRQTETFHHVTLTLRYQLL